MSIARNAEPVTDAVMPRPADVVMRLDRMGSSHPTRLSFLRSLLRRMAREEWRFDRPVWSIDARGVGRAVYRAIGPHRTYSLVAFGHDLPDHMRSDRVIATAWDATFALFDGTPDEDDLTRLEANVPLQEVGRISTKELCLSRANRSVRLFDHVVERLAQGRQPDPAEVEKVGYLMRTTAVYGSGKFGAADRAIIAERPEMKGPFQAEMLTVWLIRTFIADLVDEIALQRGGPAAAKLNPATRRMLGVGNSTGLGMAPFLVRHPALLHGWIEARETALARVRGIGQVGETDRRRLRDCTSEAMGNAASWHSEHPIQVAKLCALKDDLLLISDAIDGCDITRAGAWDALWLWGERSLTLEGQEQLAAILIEAHGPLVDDLADAMDADEAGAFRIDGTMKLSRLRELVERIYGWARSVDFSNQAECGKFWYVSEEKLEPRIGIRYEEDGADRELPLCSASLAMELLSALEGVDPEGSVAGFLLENPRFRYITRRAQIAETRPYAEIRDNLTAERMLPIDLLRCKLAFFGATHFDPRSDRWVRICLFQNSPYPDELVCAST